jgi:hypothetical protein
MAVWAECLAGQWHHWEFPQVHFHIQKCVQVFMQSACYNYLILTQTGICQQLFVQLPPKNFIKIFSANLELLNAADGQTGKHDKANVLTFGILLQMHLKARGHPLCSQKVMYNNTTALILAINSFPKNQHTHDCFRLNWIFLHFNLAEKWTADTDRKSISNL